MNEERIINYAVSLKGRFEELGVLITDPNVISDAERYARLSKEYKRLEELFKEYDKYEQLKALKEEAHIEMESAQDTELKELAKEQWEECETAIPETIQKMALMLVPEDPEDAKNAIVEIRAGTGGDEAALFARDLFKMYGRFAESQHWQLSVTHVTEGALGGYKEIIFDLSGKDVYGTMKYESGVHRVQRVPETETQGRVHTSAASVVVLPQADEVEVDIKESDLRIDTFCSSGAGGQSVNTTYSAVRIVHIPTGIVVQCQDERSQLKNKAKALAELRSRIYDMERSKQLEGVASQRKSMVSTGDRSAKIRTYNYPQGRVTDHRIGLTLHDLSGVMDGNIQPLIEALALAENTNKMNEAMLA